MWTGPKFQCRTKRTKKSDWRKKCQRGCFDVQIGLASLGSDFGQITSSNFFWFPSCSRVSILWHQGPPSGLKSKSGHPGQTKSWIHALVLTPEVLTNVTSLFHLESSILKLWGSIDFMLSSLWLAIVDILDSLYLIPRMTFQTWDPYFCVLNVWLHEHERNPGWGQIKSCKRSLSCAKEREKQQCFSLSREELKIYRT